MKEAFTLNLLPFFPLLLLCLWCLLSASSSNGWRKIRNFLSLQVTIQHFISLLTVELL